ncbi:HAMP domain-containing histidine kinase [Solihabitans fulvus]|uniref:histidine kinase n=1 Tax=Solihabitans fulvus TaxID=1892852 RepID=A0A5B2XEC6_9PSEU|nr:HAMP domain-containing sensor histidine kinase [Solihabitans fulvus]KAA2261455.1 HAMP domain-containing histidine kinase [Solihabitans fulvus]
MRPQLGLRASIVLTIVLVTTVTTAAMVVIAYNLQAGAARSRFTASAQASFDSDKQQAHQFLVQSSSRGSVVQGVASYMHGRLGLTWAVIDFAGWSDKPATVVDGMYTAAAGTGGAERGQLPVAELDVARRGVPLGSVSYTVDTHDGAQLVIVGLVEPDVLLAEFYSTARIDGELAALRNRLAAAAAAVTLLGAAVGILAARRIQRRVRLAATAARRLGGGALDTRLPVRGRDELADLAGSFNAMAQRLGESIDQLRRKDQQQRRFVADVAHDLRTPLAAMIAATQGLHSPDTAVRARSAELVGGQARRLSALVEDLLEMSRFDAGAAELRLETVDLAALVDDAVRLAAPDTGIAVRLVGDGTVLADPRRLHTIVRNLVTNAVRHGAPPVTVTIDGSAAGEVAVVVADSGPGLAPDLAPVVFDRFVRGDRARGQTEGSGLGLAIAHENALLHGGRLSVANSDGAVFTLTVPRGEPIRAE